MTKRTRILLGLLAVVLVGVFGYFAYTQFVSPMLTGMEAVTAAVANKADTTYVDDGLATKVSKEWHDQSFVPWVQGQLGKKADTESVGAELAKKADVSALTVLRIEVKDLTKKADGLATKADLVAVKAELVKSSNEAVALERGYRQNAVSELEEQLKAAKAEARRARKLAEALKQDADAAKVAAVPPEPAAAQPEPAAQQPAPEPPQERITVRWEPAS